MWEVIEAGVSSWARETKRAADTIFTSRGSTGEIHKCDCIFLSYVRPDLNSNLKRRDRLNEERHDQKKSHGEAQRSILA